MSNLKLGALNIFHFVVIILDFSWFRPFIFIIWTLGMLKDSKLSILEHGVLPELKTICHLKAEFKQH
jgi:hypothetical protein